MNNTPDYHLLLPHEIETRRASFPVAYVPWGAIEWHSYHNPIGLDGLIAEGLCRALAGKLGGLVLPAMYLATDTIKEFKGFPHSVEHKASTVKTVASELLGQLTAEGFKGVVIVTGHAGGKHTDALAEVVNHFNEVESEASAMMVTPFAPIQEQHPANHAAEGETSLLLALRPELVELGRLPSGRATNLDEDGVWGSDPRAASAEKGQEIIDAFVAAVAADVTKLLN